MFENGSGEVLAEARIVSLVAWLVAASVPPISAAAVTQLAWSTPNTAAASAAPAGMRTKAWSASQTVSRTGNLVDEELDEEHRAAHAEDHRMGEDGQVAGQRDPAEPAGERR